MVPGSSEEFAPENRQAPGARPIEALYGALRDLARWTESERVPHCVIGGIAVGLLARPRMTEDVDALALVDPQCWSLFLGAGEAFGFKSRIPDPLGFAPRARLLLLTHQPSGIPVDIALAGFPLEEQILQRASAREIDGVPIRLPAVGDLIVMKAVAGRTQDWADIESLLDMNPRVSVPAVRKRLRTWCEMIDSHEASAEFESFIARRRKRKAR